MNRIRAVIFDCDGTIVDSEHAHYRAWRQAVQSQGGELSLEEYYAYVGKPSDAIAGALAQKIKKECAREIRDDKLAYYHKLQVLGIPPIASTVDFIRRLAGEKERLGIKIAVASAIAKGEILIHLKNLEIDNLFDAVFSGLDDLTEYQDLEGVNKPKPYIYLHAAKMLGCAPAECVVIEDSQTGVMAGVDAGCITVAIPNSYSHLQDFSRAHLKMESFAAISVIDFIQMIAKFKLL